MKIELTKDRPIKGTLCKTGEVVVVRKDDGERLIEAGLANRVVEVPENRIRGLPSGPRRFSGHKVFGRR